MTHHFDSFCSFNNSNNNQKKEQQRFFPVARVLWVVPDLGQKAMESGRSLRVPSGGFCATSPTGTYSNTWSSPKRLRLLTSLMISLNSHPGVGLRIHKCTRHVLIHSIETRTATSVTVEPNPPTGALRLPLIIRRSCLRRSPATMNGVNNVPILATYPTCLCIFYYLLLSSIVFLLNMQCSNHIKGPASFPPPVWLDRNKSKHLQKSTTTLSFRYLDTFV